MSRVYATKNDFGSDESKVWTLSVDPTEEGWETDSGCDGYGLTKEQAEHYAKCINEYQSLLSKLEIAEKALEFVKGNIEKVFPKFHEEEMRLMVASEKIDSALQQLRS